MTKVNVTKNTIHIYFHNEKVKTLLDTGSDISAINLDLYNRVRTKQSVINESDITRIKGAGGALHKVIGQTELQFTIGKTSITHPFYIIPKLSHKCILGHDFLTKYCAQINFTTKTLSISNESTTSLVSIIQKQPRIKITLPSKTIIPKHSAKILEVNVSNTPENTTLLLHPRAIIKMLNLTLHKSVIQNKNNKAYILIINKSTNDTVIYQKTVLAFASKIPENSIHSISSLYNETQPDQDIEDTTYVNGQQNAFQNEAQKHSPQQPITDGQKNIKFDLSKSDLTTDQRQQMTRLLDKYRCCFATDITELGTTPLIQQTIETIDEEPVRQRPYKTTPEMKEIIEKEVERLLDAQIIEPSYSNYASPIIMIKKKQTNPSKPPSYRMVIDYRALNKKIKQCVFPLPLLDQACDTIGQNKSQIFSTMDLKSGFYNIPLDPKSKHKTTFITHHGTWAFRKSPMGLSNSPYYFQLLMNRVFAGLIWRKILVFIDDILVFSKDFDEHMQTLTDIFERLKAADVKLAPDKCSFATNSVTFLGNEITKNGIKPCVSKTNAIDNLPIPKTIKNVRQVMGQFNFYRKYIKDYSRIAYPLYQLLNKENQSNNNKINWTPQCDQAYKDLKKALTSEPILKFASADKQFTLACDGCSKGISYILLQPDDKNKLKPVAYGSKTLRREQSLWPMMQIELFAIIMGIREYKTYLINKPFTILTDCKNLTWLNKSDHTNTRLLRWQYELSQFSYKIIHIDGKSNIIPDVCSRMPSNSLAPDENIEFVPDIYSVNSKHSELTKTSHNRESISTSKYNTPGTNNHVYNQSNTTHTNLHDSLSLIDTSSAQLPMHYQPAKATGTERSLQMNPSMSAEVTTNSQIQQTINSIQAQVQELDIPRLQKQCPELHDLYNYLQEGILPDQNKKAKQIVIEASQYEMRNNKLYHLFQQRMKHKKAVDPYIYQLVIPKCLRTKILKSYHDINGCHMGHQKLYETIKPKFYWKGLYQHTYDYVTSCEVCQMTKRDRNARNTPLFPYQIDPIFHCWHIDILGGLPVTKNKNKYILLMIESFSSWCEAVSLPSQNATLIAEAVFTHIYARWSTPKILISDNAQSFNSTVLKILCQTFKVRQPKISAYKPSSNSKVEVQNSHLLERLRALCHENPNQWDIYLPACLMAMRMSCNVHSIGYSPFYVITGLNMNLDVDMSLDTSKVTGDLKQYIENMHERVKIARQIATENKERSQQIFKAYHDRNAKQPNFKVGQYVLIKIEKIPKGECKKLYPKYSGPYYITKASPKHSYQLRNTATNKLLKCFVHASRLKHYKDRTDLYRGDEDSETEDENTDDIQENNENTHDNSTNTKENNQPNENDHPLTSDTESTDDSSGWESDKNDTDDNQQTAKQNTQIENKKVNQTNMQATPAPPTQSTTNSSDTWYTVNKLLKTKMIRGVRHYLVNWSNPSWPDQWIKTSDITPRLKQLFHAGRPIRKKKRYK